MSELNVEYLENEGAQFPVTCGHVNPTAPTLLFAVGRGGSPDRHQNLLQGFHSAGFNVIAPISTCCQTRCPRVRNCWIV